MFRNFISAFFFFTIFGTTASMAEAADPACKAAGNGAEFCDTISFEKLNFESRDGISFWMHETGFLSKVLVEEVDSTAVTQSQIEAQILDVVTAQAALAGREFDFVDLSGSTHGGMPFGTMSYVMKAAGRDQTILHSYIAIEGVVLQVISQIGLTSASPAPAALRAAHASALRAVKLRDQSQPDKSDT